MKHLNLTITGKVQGVFYRKNAMEQAQKLDIKGFVQNQPDGSVYAEAEGKAEHLESFISWCNRGPDTARVKHVHVEEGELKNFEAFIIRT